MDKRSAQIATICECIDHCFAFAIWCEDFAKHVDPEDMMSGLDRGFELVSDATRLHSFLALRKMDEFFRGAKRNKDDVIATDLSIDPLRMLGEVGSNFLTTTDREDISRGGGRSASPAIGSRAVPRKTWRRRPRPSRPRRRPNT